MATVYLARDVRHDRPVALKVLLPELAAALGPERFQREIMLAARLQHPHILTVFDSGEAAGLLWFAMPFVEGESLRDRLNREKQLPVDDALRIAREAALALEYAHQRGVVHRDIKPENLLLTMDGSTLVADFGIARGVGESEQQLTSTGVAIGTPAYMSPEQASGTRELDARTDVYALGCVLYEMLAGEPPYTGPTAQAIIARALTETPRPIHPVRAGVSDALDAVIARAMAATAADRYTGAAELAAALQQVSRPPAAGKEAGVGGQARAIAPAWLTRRPLFATLLLGILIGGGALFAWRRAHVGENGARLLAVLPFENVGAPENEYFADGVSDQVRGKLTGLPGLQVTARGSSTPYKKTTKTSQQIGQELGVQFLLTGTVRWEQVGGVTRVQVNPELIQVSTGAAKWEEPFDAELTDVFQVQSDIAGKVAQALNVALAASARQRLAEQPTGNLGAYDAFLKGEQITQSMGIMDAAPLRQALPYYQQAVAEDSGFVQAWAAIALAETELNRVNPTVEGVARAQQASESALRLAPGRFEGRLAMGTYLRVLKRDYEGAHQEFMRGLETDPNNAALLTGAAGAERSLGRWDEALQHLQRAQRIDPRSVATARSLAYALHDMRRYQEALQVWDRALALSPGNLSMIQGKATTYLSLGRLDSARAFIGNALTQVDTNALIARFAKFQEMMWVLDPSLWPKLIRLTPADFDGDRGHWGLKVGGTYRLMGDTVKARAYGDSARLAFEAQLRSFPENAQLHELRGRALALGGHRQEAIEEADRSLEMRETALDASTGPYVRFQVARILIQAGDNSRALDLVEPLLHAPASDLTPGWLKIDPIFDPLRNDPRFQRLVAGGP